MNTRIMSRVAVPALFLLFMGAAAFAQKTDTRAPAAAPVAPATTAAAPAPVSATEPIALPPPTKAGGQPLMTSLSKRRTSRNFSETPLTLQQTSDLLWAAAGISSPDKRRTAPSAQNQQEVFVIMVNQQGIFRYDAVNNALKPIALGDFRAKTGTQPYAGEAPVSLMFVFDGGKNVRVDTSKENTAASLSAGAMIQNVYLYCASEGLSCVARTSYDIDALEHLLKLNASQRVLVAQSIGVPKSSK